jgi:hypothetical protein
VIKNRIELVKNGERKVLLTWHADDGEGGTIPIGMEFADDVDDEMRERVVAACKRPMNVRKGGTVSKAFYGSSAHFNALPKILARIGFRTRQF